MSAELNEGSPSGNAENQPAAVPDQAPAAARAEIENSVLDALRPLLRAKRKRKDVEDEATNEADDRRLEMADDTATDPGEPEAETAPFLPGLPAVEPAPVEAARAAAEDELDSFATIGEELERRSRQSATMVRVLEQHRQQLDVAEKSRDEAYDQLDRVVPVVRETAHALREAMDARKIDDDPARMHRLFMLNGRALDELEKVAVNLFADFLWCKSAWEQYARSVEDARKLRSQLDV